MVLALASEPTVLAVPCNQAACKLYLENRCLLYGVGSAMAGIDIGRRFQHSDVFSISIYRLCQWEEGQVKLTKYLF